MDQRASKPAGRLKLRVSAAAESSIRAGHPWVYAESVREPSREGKLGEVAIIYDRRDRFLCLGLFDPQSPIRVRVLHRGEPAPIDAEWWQRRFAAPLEIRRPIFDERTNGFRWINGESDGWPGLVLDRYDRVLALKLYTAAWLPMLETLRDLIEQQLQPASVVLRLSRNIQETALKVFSKTDGQTLSGARVLEPVVFRENGLRFEAEVVRGQKTGFFLDQRENRRAVGSLARGRRVLNAFSFSGGFSVYAAAGGARAVTDLDISKHALESAKRNYELNRAELPAEISISHSQVQADAFDWLREQAAGQFGLVVLDPPSLAKRESERAAALSAYGRLNENGIRALARGGVLVSCSCSAHVSAEEFFQSARLAAKRSGRAWEELQTTGPAPDHPATFPEARYLKAIYLRFS